MKKLMIVAIAITMTATTVQVSAQMSMQCGRGGAKPQERVELTVEEIATKQSDKMKEELKLSDKQYKKVYALNLERAKAAKSEREEMEAKRKANMELKQKRREENLASLKSILTAEQFAEVEKAQKRGENARKGGARGGQRGRNQRGPQMRGGRKGPQHGGCCCQMDAQRGGKGGERQGGRSNTERGNQPRRGKKGGEGAKCDKGEATNCCKSNETQE